MPRLYYPLSEYLQEKFGCKVFKVTLDAGLACPNRDGTIPGGPCIYCEPETLKPKGFAPGLSINEQLEVGIEKLGRRPKAEKFIAYFQINTNTNAELGFLKDIYSDAAAHPRVAALAISTRPDYLGEEVLELLKEIKRTKHLWVELGLQSSNPRTLRFLSRGHTPEDFADAASRCSASGIDVCAHVILGLPGEREADALSTMKFLAGLDIWGVKFHQLQIILGTRLERMYRSGGVSPPTLEEYAALVVKCLELLPPATVIHRLSGDVPDEYLVGPGRGGWDVNKFMVIERILGLMQELDTRQGALATSKNCFFPQSLR
jgi:hypothetical protein